jgi:hypothetical protein
MSDVSEPWSIVDVSAWRIAGEETQGLQPHQWLSHESRKRTWLFKPLRPEPWPYVLVPRASRDRTRCVDRLITPAVLGSTSPTTNGSVV